MYSAHAVFIELETKSEMTGRFITFGRDLDIGTTEIEIFGNPMSVTRHVLTLSNAMSLD
jgi:hypothetical protein